MDLSFHPPLPDRELVVPPCDLALVVAAATAAGVGSATVRAQASLDAAPDRPAPDGFAPVSGSFDGAVAAALGRWRGE